MNFSYWFGFLWGTAWTLLTLYSFRLPPKVTVKILPPAPEHEPEVNYSRHYRNMLEPIANKFKVAAVVDGGTVNFNRLGCESMYHLMRELGTVLDRAVDRQLAEKRNARLDNLAATCYIPEDNMRTERPK